MNAILHSATALSLRSRLRADLGPLPRVALLPLLGLCFLASFPGGVAAQRLDGLHAGSVANAADELLVVGAEIDRAAPGDLVFAVGEGFGDDPSRVQVLLDDREVLPLPEPLFASEVVAFVVPLEAEGEVEVRVAVGERTTAARTLRVETPPALQAPEGYARRTFQATLALTFLLESEVRLAAQAGVPVDPDLYGQTLRGQRRSLLEALEGLPGLPREDLRHLDRELFDANALVRIQQAARDLARRGPDCDDVERFAGHAGNALSGLGSIIGGCVPGVGGCIGGILSGLGNVASSVQAEAARECARQKEEEEKKRWEDLFQRLDGLEEGQQRLETKADRLEGMVGRLEAKLDRLEAKVDRTEAKLDRIESKLDRLEAKADRQAEALAKLEAKADKMERKLDRQEKKLDTLEIKLDRLEIKADKAEKKLDKIEAKLDRQEKKLDRLEQKLDRQEKKLDAQEKKLDQQEKKLDTHEKKLDQVERKLDRRGGGRGGDRGAWDFGDAPDGEGATGYAAPFAQQGRFPSRRNTPHGITGHGIRHRVVAGEGGDRLGATKDGEAEAATVDRDRDDLPGGAGPLSTDRRGGFEVTVHADPGEPASRYLNLLCDLDRDGDWADAGEWVVSNREVSRDTAGGFLAEQTVRLEVAPDGSLDPGLYWLRLSLTRRPLPGDSWDGSGPASGYQAGETEDFLLEVR